VTAAREYWRIALGALRANWFRALLTAVGVVIGVASLIMVTAVSDGASHQIAASIQRLGANVVEVDGEFISVGTRQSATDRTITPGDVAEIAKLPEISLVAPHQDIESQVVSAGRFQTNTWLVGMTPSYASVYNQRIARGRGITNADQSFGREVMVLGLDAAARLFPGQDAIGKTVRVGSHEFEVIGLQARRGQLADENLDNRIFVPLRVVTRVLLGGANVVHLSVRASSASEVTPAEDAMSEVLLRRHALPPGYPEDFSTQDQASILKEGQAASTTFKALTFALGGISLLVGGIGIMNMMLVSVHERTREIGIRKSVGASPFMVQAQFLIEAIVLSTLGGVAGVLAGIGSVNVIGSLAGWETLISVPSLVIAFSVALVIGLVFGYYPARRASRLDPISALRYE
jgi:putative ABC transport system permease protein